MFLCLSAAGSPTAAHGILRYNIEFGGSGGGAKNGTEHNKKLKFVLERVGRRHFVALGLRAPPLGPARASQANANRKSF